MNTSVIDWLLEHENPSVRYRTLVELLDEPVDDPEVTTAREQLLKSKPVQRIFKKMHPDGYWLQKNPRTKEVLGDGVAYGSFATTHFCLAYLAELGLDGTHPLLDKAVNRYLDLQAEDGDFWDHLSCLLGYNIRTFVMLGYRDDPHVQKSIDLLLNTTREDGGYLCDLHANKYKTRETKSCIRGAAKVLVALSELPEYWDHPRCKQLLDYFFKRDIIFTMRDPDKPVQRDVVSTIFPFTWGAGLIEILLALSKMGYGNRPEVRRAWEIFHDKKETDGRYPLDWTPSQAPFNVGRRNEPNKWVTFYALLAEKYRGESS